VSSTELQAEDIRWDLSDLCSSAEEARTLGLAHRVVPGNDLIKHSREYAQMLLAKPFRPLTEMKARINAIARTGMPEVNAMTEGFLQRD